MRTSTAAILTVMFIGCAVRFTGLTRGLSDYVVPTEEQTVAAGEAYYQFHPDEATVIGAALRLSDPRDPPLTAYGMPSSPCAWWRHHFPV